MREEPRVFTLSLNSSLDHTYYVERILFEDINRVEEKRVDAGGKGINVGRMLARLGAEIEVICFLGGETGKKIASLLKEEGVKFRPIYTKGETRNIFNFVEKKTGRTLRINEKGPLISPEEEERLFSCLDELELNSNDIFVISGSLPPGLKVDTYRRIVEKMKSKTPTVVLDTDGEPLKEGVKSLPFMIKPNLWELERLLGERIESFGRLKERIPILLNKGISVISLTLGEKGALVFWNSHLLYGAPPKITPESSIGCGDAFLSGFLFHLLREEGYRECLRYAIACGTAKATKKGTLMPEKEEGDRFVDEVEIYPAIPGSLHLRER
ncbi:MAG: hypothetical protein DRP73_05570 [Candidatus Omnitrophota bacterium]|nr:MAG: hypothetical protein DRP73_05570 [Candidatus Omnitrophota bacterium]